MEQEFSGKIKNSFLKRAASAALEVALPTEQKDKLELSIFITDEPGMTILNKKYRRKEKPTDVLSFSFTEKRKPEEPHFISPGSSLFLGEVVLCYPYIRSQAEHEGQPLSQAFSWATVHGVLHLLGRKHYKKADKQIMQDEEKRALQLLSNKEY